MPNARVDAAVRVFFTDAINIYISRLSKADRPPQRGWAACDPQRTEKSEVPRGRGDSARSRRRSRPTRSIAPSWVCGLSSASPADFALARPHMCTSQFLRTFFSLSLCIYTSMQTTHWLCFSGEPCCQTCPHRASHRYSASLRARETSDHRHGRTGPNVNALWAPSHSQLTPRPTRQTPAGPSSPGAAAVEKDSFARYLLKPLAGARRERAGASPASPAEAEGRDACSGAGAGRSARGAAGEVLGTQRENYSQGN